MITDVNSTLPTLTGSNETIAVAASQVSVSVDGARELLLVV